ncbi:MAG: translation initiation factor 1 [Candidatus Azotimanducaceae bacterium]|jgi:translation initiation factor 1
MAQGKGKGNLVYSTDQGRLCPGCHRAKADCVCKDASRLPETDGVIRLQRETKGRNGKPVVLISGLPLSETDLKKLAKELKAKCGVGGTIEAGKILIQGDKRDIIRQTLEGKGYKVKISGG